jgi:SPP1 gp7 family putative phage head morphogenesis protein
MPARLIGCRTLSPPAIQLPALALDEKPKRKLRTFSAVHPNCGVEAYYSRELRKLIEEMHDEVSKAVEKTYRKHEPILAQDATPAIALRDAIRKLSKTWLEKFDTLSGKLARFFGKSTAERTDASLKSALKKGGVSVSFKMTAAAKDVMAATIAAQVGLIKSIPQKYLTEVQGLVMRSVQTGRDLSTLADELEKRYKITKKRAALIARDQNNKATASITRVRQEEIGITHAIWMHSGGDKHPRPKHLKANGRRYDIKKGLKIGDNGEWVFPGEEVGCTCVSRSVVPGFN